MAVCCCFQSFLQLHFGPVRPFSFPFSFLPTENISLFPDSRNSSAHAISLLSLPGVDMQSVPKQTPELQTRMRGSSVSMSCQLSAKDTVHWYRLLPGEPPERILYDSGGTPVFDESSESRRMQIRTDAAQPIYHLTINSLTPRDSGTYYCAYWYRTTVLAGQRKALQKGCLCPKPQAVNSAKNSNTSLFYPIHDLLQQLKKTISYVKS